MVLRRAWRNRPRVTRGLARGRLEPLEARRLLFGIGIHQEITAEALGFLRDSVLDQINDEHFKQDVFGQFTAANHFDGSYFQASAAKLNERHTDAVGFTNPGNFRSTNAADALGKNLHAVQDFYAHSNWVELQAAGLLDPTALVDQGMGSWDPLLPYTLHAGVLTVEGDSEQPLGPASSLTRAGFVITVNDGTTVYPGMITGSVNPVLYGPDATPDSVALSHGGLAGNSALPGPLAKDDAEAPLYSEARALAVAQTRRELFRLIKLTESRWGSAQALVDAWVDPAQLEAFGQFLATEAARLPDLVPPQVTSSEPSAVVDGGNLPDGVIRIGLGFSEPVSVLDGGRADRYRLTSPGPNDAWGDGDDVVVGLMPQFLPGASSVVLVPSGGPLATGRYRLEVAPGGGSFRDLSGNQLDGDGNGTPGGTWSREFSVGAPPLIGDANGDCTVGAADYAIWAAQFGQSGVGLSADFDGNGSVGAGDYALWAANFGKSCAGPAAAVPSAASATPGAPQPTAGRLWDRVEARLTRAERLTAVDHLFGQWPSGARGARVAGARR